jgi:hypothetical protein
MNKKQAMKDAMDLLGSGDYAQVNVEKLDGGYDVIPYSWEFMLRSRPPFFPHNNLVFVCAKENGKIVRLEKV